MAEGEEGDKTEEPTERRLTEARRKGDTPSTREPGTAAALVALFALAAFLAPALLDGLTGAFAGLMAHAPTVEVGTGRQGLRDLGLVSTGLMRAVALLLAPLMGVLALGAVVGALAQGGFVVAPERLVPKLSKISPAAGVKRLVSPETLVEFAKNLVKVALVALVTGLVGVPAVAGLWHLVRIPPEAVLAAAGAGAARMLGAAAIVVTGLALLDLLWKRMRWHAKQRMTLKEVRDERKDSEGDPLLRGRRDMIRRQRARQRIASAVPAATVVITNPTHFAVALRYEAGRDAAPVCVAKGTDRIAARIRDLAREAEVPMVENRRLARALYAAVEVEAVVPVEHWQAVAEIIGYLDALRRDVGRRPPPGSALRRDA